MYKMLRRCDWKKIKNKSPPLSTSSIRAHISQIHLQNSNNKNKENIFIVQFNQYSQRLSPKHCYSRLHGFRYLEEQTWLAQLPTYRCLQIKPSLCINNFCLQQTTPLIRFRSHTPSAWATIQIICKFTLMPHLWWPQNLNLWTWR